MVFFQVSSMILRHPKLQSAKDQQPKSGMERLDLWQSTNSFFKNTGTELAHGQISFDLFDFSYGQKKGYKNFKTFSDISARSSGNCYFYPEFNQRTHSLKFSNELYHNLSRKLAWEAVFRIRLSHGFTQLESFGNIQIKAKTQDLVLCPTMDSDRVISYEFEKAPEDAGANNGRVSRINKKYLFVQSALLYSTSEGQRRIRCHNIAVPLTNQVSEAYEFIDIIATSHMLTRKALSRFDQLTNVDASKAVVEASLNNLCKAIQRSARTPKGQHFEFSENIQYLIMYCLGVLKSQILSIPLMMNPLDTIDKVVYQRFLANSMSPEELLPVFSPQIINISDPDLNDQNYPPLEVLERRSLRPDCIYLSYNAFGIYMYIGRQTDPYFIEQIFKV